MMKKLLLALGLVTAGALSLAQAGEGAVVPATAPAPAAAGAAAGAEAAVRAAVLKFAPGVQIDQVSAAPMPGFYQVIASGQLVYVSADGKYMLHGNLVDLAGKKDLSDSAWAAFRKAELAKVPVSQRIVYAPPRPVHTITVFTDVTCPYCRELHKHIAELNKQGIAVQYLAWPREGLLTTAGNPTKTYTEMVSVWCAADRAKAFTAANDGDAPKAASCDNPVKQQFDLGLKLGVNGTPAVIAEDGTLIGGYLSPEQMRAKLDALAAPGGKS